MKRNRNKNRNDRMVSVKIFDITDTHINGLEVGGNWITLCGLDGDDPGLGQSIVESGPEKITCKSCYEVWIACRAIKPSDFDGALFGGTE
jgi:hypothetical protein